MSDTYVLNATDSLGDTISATLTTDGGITSADITSISGTFDGMAITGLDPSNFGDADNILYPTQADSVDDWTAYFDNNGLSFDAGDEQINIYAVGNDLYSEIVDEDTYSVTTLTVCFCAGTMIATPHGEKKVEDLNEGDAVLTASGEIKPVRWLGRSDVSARFASSLKSAPIRITAGALGEDLPARDLRVSPAHAVFLGGILIQAGALVNGITILRETIRADFSYYHVELESHELLITEGLASESFVDNVDRMNFVNWPERSAPVAPIPEMHLPRAKSARQVPTRLRNQIAARAAWIMNAKQVA